MTRYAGGLCALLAFAAITGGCGGTKTAAKVNQDTITEEAFLARLADVDAMELTNSARSNGPAKAGEFAMRALITEKLILQLAASKGASPTKEQVKDFRAFARRYPQAVGANPYRTEEGAIRDAELQVAMRNLMAKPLKITDAEINEEYDRLKSELVEPRQYRLRIVETADKARAEAAADKLKKGISFETVALTDSDDPSLRARSGDTGLLPEPAMPAAMKAALAGLKPGEYTKAPIRVDAPVGQGQPAGAPVHWFLAQLVEIKEARKIPLKDVRYDIEGRAIARKDPSAGQRVMALLRDYIKNAKIEVSMKGYEDVAKAVKDSAAAPVAAAPPQPGGTAPAPPGGQAPPPAPEPGHEGHDH